ncbi:E3 ubiquitin-protein ligase RNF169-like isoform X3 [Dreissena polymorpha]|uniref:E3 ubiquitin-protein ligase RNF169-like isoform X2 n=1 Tax=Dreissena polymorpha TaxID=45954 RepID=UPI00226553BD|nr:E3 ubiquitin-protein ligase RNF169-like isoform X2 [Dreissena polymorpha]XP_052216661.1 E3 ubiquitin-protein ligase RNF169-like isoform X3 [Dreissena polymorpha]
MKLEDNICPICLYVFIQPVTMPCCYELCLECFKQNVEEANFCCPMCRTRISTWARRAARNKALVNEVRWTAIKNAFTDQVKNRLEGLEEEDEEMNALNISIKLAEPGEIRSEFEEQLRMLREQRALEARQEAEASERLIRQLQEEEAGKLAELEEIRRKDEELALQLSRASSNDSEIVIRSSTSRSHSSSSSSLGNKTPMKSPYGDSPFLLKTFSAGLASPGSQMLKSFSPTHGTGKGCSTEGSALLRKIRHDENLITTQDIENMEEAFKKNTPKLDRSTSLCSVLKIQTPSQTLRGLHRSEILDQMSKSISINIDDLESNSSTPPVNPKPIFPTMSPTLEKEGGPSETVLRAHSTDSITQELNHFRPIRSCPLTPPRRLPSGQVVEPLVIRTTPRNLSKSMTGSPSSPDDQSLAEIDAGSPIMKRRLTELAEERKDKVDKMSKSTCTASTEMRDENKNPDIGYKLHQTKPSAGNRNVDFKDISNSAVLSNKHCIQVTKGGIKEKLIIPLEADLDGEDIFGDTVASIHCETKHEATMKSGRLSRKQTASKTKQRYTESPQQSLLKWAKPVDIVQVANNDTEVERDNTNNKAVCAETKRVRNGNIVKRPLRVRKTVRDPDFLYDSFKQKKAAVDIDDCDEPDSMQVGDIGSGDDDNEEVINLDSDSQEELAVVKKAKRRRLNESKSEESVESQTVKSTRQFYKKPVNQKGCLKESSRKTLSKKKTYKCKTKKGENKYSKAEKTMEDYFEATRTQEENDMLMACELQKQFELEAKLHLNSFRFKGSSGQYELRQTRGKATESCET